MEENEIVTDVTDEPETEENGFPYGPVFLALAAGATSALVTAKIMKARKPKLEVVEIDTDEAPPSPPAPPAES
jgi:hypothetical protein